MFLNGDDLIPCKFQDIGRRQDMITIDMLQKLLKVREADLQKIDTERLRTALGTFRYFIRFLEREINRRDCGQPLSGSGKEAGQDGGPSESSDGKAPGKGR
jgi:hypothetical protein